jgi:hypothetical protein
MPDARADLQHRNQPRTMLARPGNAKRVHSWAELIDFAKEHDAGKKVRAAGLVEMENHLGPAPSR